MVARCAGIFLLSFLFTTLLVGLAGAAAAVGVTPDAAPGLQQRGLGMDEEKEKVACPAETTKKVHKTTVEPSCYEDEEEEKEDRSCGDEEEDTKRERTKVARIHAWENFTITDMWNDLKCDDIFSSPRPIHNDTMWMLMRAVYHGLLGASSTIELSVGHGVAPGVEARQTREKGRGLFATRPIKKGELVCSGKRFGGLWYDAKSYRLFLSLLPDDLACDVIQWAYPYFIQEPVPHAGIVCELDIQSFCNDGGFENGNVGCDKEAARNFTGGCHWNDFALRDIEAGEELECVYEEFVADFGWRYFGL